MPEADPQDYLAARDLLKQRMTPPPEPAPPMPAVRPPPIPAPPQFQDIPKPPKQQYSDPIQAFQNPAILLASLGSLFTRAPLTAAMNAGAAAMEAYHKGDKETLELKQKEWEEQAKQAQEQNKVELEKYKDIWMRRDVDVKQKFAELAAYAAGYKDQLLNAAVASGNTDIVEKVILARETAQMHLSQSLNLYEEKLKLQQQMHPLPDETADFMARQLIKGNTSQLTGLFRSQGAKVQVEERARQILMNEQGLTAEQAANQVVQSAQEFAGTRAGAQALGRREAQVIGASTTALATAPRVLEASEKVDRTQFPSINRIILMAQQGTGGENVIRFGIAVNTFINNYARALGAGSAVLTDTARKEAMQNLETAWSKGQIKAAIDQMLNKELPSEITGAKMGMREFLKQTMEESKTPDDGWTIKEK